MWTLLGAVESVLIREASSIQGWIVTQWSPSMWTLLGPVESVLIREVPSIQGWIIHLNVDTVGTSPD